MSDDALASRTPEEVAAFYERLADAVDKNKGNLEVSLAALLMKTWLTNRSPSFVFDLDPPKHLREDKRIISAFTHHHAVYLTKEKAKIGEAHQWGGIIPRVQNGKWGGDTALDMHYEGLIEMPIWLQLSGSDAERDLLYSLRGFQLRTEVLVAPAVKKSPTLWNVKFSSFEALVIDRYDWDVREHITVPNPDYGSSSKGAIDPGSKSVKVYHTNARRLENMGLAAPFDIRSKKWPVKDLSLLSGAVNPQKKLY
jgi:hypothetical protein